MMMELKEIQVLCVLAFECVIRNSLIRLMCGEIGIQLEMFIRLFNLVGVTSD